MTKASPLTPSDSSTLHLEDRIVLGLLVLGLLYSLATLAQIYLPPLFFLCLPLGVILYSCYREPTFSLPKSLTFAIFVVGLLTWVFFAAYYPERDNDSIQFWMPKAKALALFGFLPAVGPADPRFTISHDYPLGLVGLSGLWHSFKNDFSIEVHRLTIVFQSLLLWMSLGRFLRPSRQRYWELLMFVLIAPLPALWANGYHDTLWALSFTLGLGWLLIERNLWKAVLYLSFAAMGKSEGQTFLFIFMPILLYLSRNWKLLWALLPSLLWIFVCRYHNFEASRHLIFPPHSLLDVIDAIMKSTLQLVRFRTLFGSVSLGLIVAAFLVVCTSKTYLWVPALALATYVAAYAFSSFDVDWNVLFSWPRILFFPIISILVLKGREIKLGWALR